MIYINSIGSISPQGTIEDGHFACVEPIYRELINPLLLRRMSRILKMGLGASTLCINNLPGIEIDAVIVGTGLACIIDLEKFLVSFLDKNEQSISPIPFINSSHNTVAAQIAMMSKITGYNNTFCHRGISFEAALQDAIMLLNEKEAKHVLVGGIDEYSKHYQLMKSDERKMKNVVLGEGATFFILEKEQRKDTFGEIGDVHSFLMKNDENDEVDTNYLKNEISCFLQKNNLDMNDIDVFVSGKNGNCITDVIYNELEKDCFQKAETVYYKHLCGEYMTSTAFALEMITRKLKGEKGKRVLIYNHYNYTNHSLILLDIKAQ